MRIPFWLFVPAALLAQVNVPFERIRDADKEPGNWLTYSGNYSSHRYSRLDQITTGNVARLKPVWVYQTDSTHKFEATPLVVDGIMYLAEPPSNVSAMAQSLPSGWGTGWWPSFASSAASETRSRKAPPTGQRYSWFCPNCAAAGRAGEKSFPAMVPGSWRLAWTAAQPIPSPSATSAPILVLRTTVMVALRPRVTVAA